MARQLMRGALLAAMAFAPASTALLAQVPETGGGGRDWHVAVWAKGGQQLPSGVFAHFQLSDLEELANYLSEFRVEPATVLGGGIEMIFPSQSIATRVGWESSTLTEARGQLGLCNVFTGEICEPEIAETRFHALMADTRFLMRRPRDRIRPLLLAGIGFRAMSFDAPTCDPGAADPRICQTIVALYESPPPHVYLRMGLGLEVQPDPLVFNVVASVGTGRYLGPNERVKGQWYDEVRFEASASYIVF